MLRDSTCRGSRFSDFPDFQIVVGMLPLGRRSVWENLTNSSREVNTGNLHYNLGAVILVERESLRYGPRFERGLIGFENRSSGRGDNYA